MTTLARVVIMCLGITCGITSHRDPNAQKNTDPKVGIGLNPEVNMSWRTDFGICNERRVVYVAFTLRTRVQT